MGVDKVDKSFLKHQELLGKMRKAPPEASWFTTKAEKLVETVRFAANWGRKWSFYLQPFVTACCAMEYMSVSCAHFDISRFGAEIPRFSPRQSDLIMIVGTIVQKQAPVLKRIWEQMLEPKWSLAFGVCASTGGFYDNYATLPGADRAIPIDIYVPGCPPRPEAILDAIIKLQDLVTHDTTKPLLGVKYE
jgi:NADH-quinone oxidoreductase subunit B